MDFFHITGGLSALALFAYLLVALLRPELFE
jgi:K+-transporting ATPase KdpF subunit